ncbi:glycosyl hydrolase [Melampsora americana]|nr:glycosyl hydrolase [Melampsora americana]
MNAVQGWAKDGGMKAEVGHQVAGQRKRIVSGADWNDDAGKQIQAHGGYLLGVETAIGTGLVRTRREGKGSVASVASSFKLLELFGKGADAAIGPTDLLTWTRLPNALTSTAGTPLNDDMVIERPRVLFNQATNKFVMYFHYDDAQYKLAQIGVATSDRIDSGWKFERAVFTPQLTESKQAFEGTDQMRANARDMEPDGNANLKLARLSEDYVSGCLSKILIGQDQRVADQIDLDQMDVEELVYIWKKVFWEATGIIKEEGVYHMIFSLQVGLRNPNKVVKANSLAGPWSEAVEIADPKLNTYSSQNTNDITVTGTQARTHIFTGDRWTTDSLANSKYIWAPLRISNGNFRIDWHDVWEIDVQTGIVTVAEGIKYDIPDGQSGNGPLKFQAISGTSPDGEAVEWCSIHYTSPGGTYRTGQMSVNGGGKFNVHYPPTSAQLSIPVPVKAGARR